MHPQLMYVLHTTTHTQRYEATLLTDSDNNPQVQQPTEDHLQKWQLLIDSKWDPAGKGARVDETEHPSSMLSLEEEGEGPQGSQGGLIDRLFIGAGSQIARLKMTLNS